MLGKLWKDVGEMFGTSGGKMLKNIGKVVERCWKNVWKKLWGDVEKCRGSGGKMLENVWKGLREDVGKCWESGGKMLQKCLGKVAGRC